MGAPLTLIFLYSPLFATAHAQAVDVLTADSCDVVQTSPGTFCLENTTSAPLKVKLYLGHRAEPASEMTFDLVVVDLSEAGKTGDVAGVDLSSYEEVRLSVATLSTDQEGKAIDYTREVRPGERWELL